MTATVYVMRMGLWIINVTCLYIYIQFMNKYAYTYDIW